MVSGDGTETLQGCGGYTYEQGELRGAEGEERRGKEKDGCPLTITCLHLYVRGHPSVSLPLLSSSTLPLFICIFPTPLYYLQGPHPKLMTFVFKVR
jgi:hypothetical protein